MVIQPRVSLVTLGVSDVARATAFYESLGWPRSPASVDGEVSFFRTAGALLALWGRDELAADAQLPQPPAEPAFRGVSLAINLETPQEVDRAFEQVRTAGGEIVKAPQRAEWGGYVGYFRDLDGHLWEIAHNPGWPIGADGVPRLP
jgi:catechol 2,3-dioxygenase-like lactoylglutathione lyase family enzyme